MAYEIIVKKRFTNKVQKVLAYLEKEWSLKVAEEFLAKIDQPHYPTCQTTSSWRPIF